MAARLITDDDIVRVLEDEDYVNRNDVFSDRENEDETVMLQKFMKWIYEYLFKCHAKAIEQIAMKLGTLVASHD
ncbi:unnamed protein product [Euphydryas editha]|uniref:Uncharacterized protein n=1 Tax=Euphydryas editha TaxID=104508 RepID=A0AAU9UVZ4_EUPED|nr:unnamed protein product [Euphydryas editha]